MNLEIKFDLPETINVDSEELKTLFLYTLFGRGIVSSGQAAKILNISKRTFIENAGKYGVSIFQYENEEVSQELTQWQ